MRRKPRHEDVTVRQGVTSGEGVTGTPSPPLVMDEGADKALHEAETQTRRCYNLSRCYIRRVTSKVLHSSRCYRRTQSRPTVAFGWRPYSNDECRCGVIFFIWCFSLR